jgi:hypothetical protein
MKTLQILHSIVAGNHLAAQYVHKICNTISGRRSRKSVLLVHLLLFANPKTVSGQMHLKLDSRGDEEWGGVTVFQGPSCRSFAFQPESCVSASQVLRVSICHLQLRESLLESELHVYVMEQLFSEGSSALLVRKSGRIEFCGPLYDGSNLEIFWQPLG